MDLGTLRTFVLAVRRGSFAAAARDLGTAPSSVSRAVAGLEGELGVRLLHRSTRRLAPTEAGQAYFDRVEAVVDELDAARAAVVGPADQPTGRLRVTAPVSWALCKLVPALPAFAERYPALSVDLVLTDTVLDLLAERIDVALRLGVLADSSLVSRRVAPIRYVACASPAYLARGRPAEPGELVDHGCLVLALPGWERVWSFRRPGGPVEAVPVRGRVESTNVLALRDLAIGGLGVALVPDWTIGDALADGRLVDLFPDREATGTRFDAAVWAVSPSRRHVPAKTRAFVAFVCGE